MNVRVQPVIHTSGAIVRDMVSCCSVLSYPVVSILPCPVMCVSRPVHRKLCSGREPFRRFKHRHVMIHKQLSRSLDWLSKSFERRDYDETPLYMVITQHKDLLDTYNATILLDNIKTLLVAYQESVIQLYGEGGTLLNFLCGCKDPACNDTDTTDIVLLVLVKSVSCSVNVLLCSQWTK
eukprot:gene9216-19113_t